MKQERLIELKTCPDDSIERNCLRNGYATIAGVDEAGRGPLAGPVVAAAVILPIPCPIKGLNDSKVLSTSCREHLYDEIIASCISYGIGICEPELIDKVNILRSTLIAMESAVLALNKKPDMILIDGISRIPTSIPQKLIKKGDARCLSISAASILAKVTRDRIMLELDKLYPGYGFATHFGYPTVSHRQAIAQLGPSPVHRKTFRGVKEFAPGISKR